jgi:hypothetical protein
VGRVITISKASLKPRNPKFNTTPHEFEVYLDRGSTLAVVDDNDPDVAAIPRIMFNVSAIIPALGCLLLLAPPHIVDGIQNILSGTAVSGRMVGRIWSPHVGATASPLLLLCFAACA